MATQNRLKQYAVGKRRRMCPSCRIAKRHEAFGGDFLVCLECHKQERRERQRVSDQKSSITTFRKTCAKIRKAAGAAGGTLELREFSEAVGRRMGGVDKLAEMVLANYHHNRGTDEATIREAKESGELPADGFKMRDRKAVLEYDKMFLTMMRDENALRGVTGMEGLADEELEAVLIETAMSAIRQSPQLKLALLRELLLEDPEFVVEFLADISQHVDLAGIVDQITGQEVVEGSLS